MSRLAETRRIYLINLKPRDCIALLVAGFEHQCHQADRMWSDAAVYAKDHRGHPHAMPPAPNELGARSAAEALTQRRSAIDSWVAAHPQRSHLNSAEPEEALQDAERNFEVFH
jgi:1,2-phenylacetyl-CoA epoxidase PaaB subunit